MSSSSDRHLVAPLSTGGAPETKPPTVLCVDDDPNVSEAIARKLLRLGIRVLRAYDGVQGCWLAATEKPDVIVLDVAMPKGNGDEILELLQRNEQTASVPVLVLTGKTDPGLCHKMKKLGAARFLSKPIPFDELLEEIARYVSVPV